jgi:uncharacterized protein (TIGR00299 family) protein
MRKSKSGDPAKNPQSAIRNPQSGDRSPGRVIYIEPFSGISGDMMLGALLDLGADLERLRLQLGILPLKGYKIAAGKCMRAGIQAVKFDVHVEASGDMPGHAHGHRHAGHPHRSFRDISKMISTSGLSPWVREKALDAFRRLAEAEGKIHNLPVDQVHFHEVGAVDSIVDIVGTMIALEQFLPARILSSSVNVGHGTLECQHGIYPVPGPAAQELLKGIPTFSNSVAGELTTPTGAALLVSLVGEFCPRPPMKIQQSGYGAGTRQTPGSANVLRVTMGEEISDAAVVSPEEQVVVVEATIDDMSPQVYGYFQEKAIAAGALDVYATPIQMKKNRPAVLITLVCPGELLDTLCRLIFEETTTIGVRYTLARRKTLRREFVRVQTEYGAITVKISRLDGRKVNAAPEYENCRRLAVEKGVPLKEVLAAASFAYFRSPGAQGE